MLKSITTTLLIVILFLCTSNAQGNFTYGIKAGMNISTLNGDLEADSQGKVLESKSYLTGFHIGAIFFIDIIDNKFGVSPEIMFIQKGGKRKYQGPGYLPINTSSGILDKRGNLNVVNTSTLSYLSIPVMLYYKPIERIKIAGGLDLGIRLAASGSGESQFFWTDLAGINQNLILGHDFNYNKDDAGEADLSLINTLVVDAGTTTIDYPNSVGGYYFNEEKDGHYFNVFDLGLTGDVTFFVTKGIALGLRASYGLLDVTNNFYDTSKQDPSISRSDKDKNLTFQLSLSFNF